MSAAPRVLVRTVASAEVGAGHLRRCLALAGALRELGADVHFALPQVDAPYADWVGARGFGLHRVGEAAPQEDAACSLAAVRRDLVIVDDYRLDARWHEAASAGGARIAVIDDLADRALAADWVVDPNEQADPAAKYAGRLQRPARLLGGSRFALLDAAYEHARRCTIVPEVRSIGIFMGGGDALGLTEVVLSCCRRVFDGPIEVVATSAHPGLPALRARAAADPRLRLSVDLAQLSDFYARHDLQLGAGGGASWERCCIGAPTLALAAADNQRQVLPRLAARGAVVFWDGDPWRHGDALGREIARLVGDVAARRRLAEQGRQLVDGRGARRVALALSAQRLETRAATLSDAVAVWRWRNAPDVRATAHDPAEIALEAHLQWFAGSLQRPDRLMLVGEIAGTGVGFVRFDLASAGQARVSIFLDPDLAGLGLGSPLLARAEAALSALQPAVHTVEAQVLEGNARSRRLFRRAGYHGGTTVLHKRLAGP